MMFTACSMLNLRALCSLCAAASCHAAQDEAKESALALSKLEAVATKLKDSQEAAARELVQYQTKAREDAAALEKAREKANHFR